MEPGNKDDEQMAVRHGDASGGDTAENQHEESRMRDIHRWQKRIRASSASSSSGPAVLLEYLASGETQKSAVVRTCAEVRSC